MNNINILERKLIKSPWLDEANPSTRLSTCDQTSVAIATSRATFWRAHIDAQTLEKCLQLVLEDLPFLGGRMAPLKLPMGWKLGQLQVTNNNEGLEFTIAKAAGGLTLSNFGPNTWPMRNATISNPEVPPFIPRMDVGKKLLSGKEPLCKVQLTKVEDGSILAITLSHTITDGMHWPALMVHIAARYRQVASGIPAPTQELIECATSRTDLSLSRVKSNLMAEG